MGVVASLNLQLYRDVVLDHLLLTQPTVSRACTAHLLITSSWVLIQRVLMKKSSAFEHSMACLVVCS